MPTSSNGKGKRQTSRKTKAKSGKKKASTASSFRRKRVENISTEKPLSMALEAARMGVWDYDIEANSIEWSEHVHKLLGLEENAFDGTLETYMNLVHPEDRPLVMRDLDDATRLRKNYNSEHRVIWPSGAIRWVEAIGKVSLDKKGKVVRMTGTIQDITEKKEIERDRKDWKTRFELISASAGLVIYDYDIPSGDIRWSGDSESMLGYAPEELGNVDRWVQLIHPEDRDTALRLLEDAEKDLRPYDVNYRFSRKSGGYCHMHDRGVFIADNNGLAVRMMGIMIDVSERIMSENTIRESIRFRESIESTMPGILYVYDVKNQRLVYTNRNLPGQLGYTLEELQQMGDRFIEGVLHEDDRGSMLKWSNEPGGTVRENEFRVKLKGGGFRWLMSRSTPFRYDEDGTVSQVIGIAQDVTTRKEAIDQLNRSEQSYRELFENVTEAIYLQKADGTFIDVNRSACQTHGYEKHELLGKTAEFLSAEGKNDFDLIRLRMEKALQGKPQAFEFWSRKKKGEIFLLEIRLARGSYFGTDIIIATGRDITQRRNTEQALRDSEQRFRTLQHASFGGIGLHDRGMIIDCNQGLCDITGYPYEELIGFNGFELVAPEWRNFVIEKIQTGYEKPYDVEGVRKDGSRYMLEIQGKNIPYEGRHIRVTEFRDVTERKRNEQKIVEQNAKLLALTEELMRKNDQLEEFTQIVSHNLRSPVGNIVTLLSFFEGADSDSERQEYVNLLKESTATTLYMLNDLNEILKVKQNKNIERQELSFETTFNHVKTMLNAKISEAQAELTCDFSAAQHILYPPVYLESILLNLLDNALKYAHPDRKPKVQFKTYLNRSGNTILEASDNGLGINLERYGHQVFKLRKTFHRHPESRGIGLFMIKNQIEAMGGEISLTSKEAEGTTFFINFNKHQAHA